jgi:hypothetical protein
VRLRGISTSDRLEVLRRAPGYVEHVGGWCAQLEGAASVILDVRVKTFENVTLSMAIET